MTPEDASSAFLLCVHCRRWQKSPGKSRRTETKQNTSAIGLGACSFIKQQDVLYNMQEERRPRNECSGRQDVFCHHNNTGRNHSTCCILGSVVTFSILDNKQQETRSRGFHFSRTQRYVTGQKAPYVSKKLTAFIL